MRIDSHHYLTSAHTIEHLAQILERNRFEGSIWMVQPEDALAPVDHPAIQGFSIDWARRDSSHAKLRAARLDLASDMPDNRDLAALAGRNLTLDLKFGPEHLPSIARMAEAEPILRIVLAEHSWPEGMEALAQYPHIAVKAAGLLTTEFRPRIQSALKAFGAHRMLFGSAWPNCLPEHIWKETLAAFTQCIGAQTIQSRELLLGENARRIYGN